MMNIEQLKDAWNAQADRHNQWDDLGVDEIVSFAQTQAPDPVWKNVKKDGFPLCNSEIVYVGINGAGYCGCFNSITNSPYEQSCWYDTAEGTALILSGLMYWKPLVMPERP